MNAEARGALNEPQGHDVFLSYSSRDAGVAAGLRHALADAEVSVWWDTETIRDGHVIDQRLRDGIDRSRLTVVLHSPAHLASGVCRWELLRSLAQGDARGVERVLFVFLDGDPAKAHQSGLARRGVSFDGSAAAIEQVLTAVKEALITLPPQAASDNLKAKASIVGLPGSAGDRFVGRLDTLLTIRDALGSSMRNLDAGILHNRDVCVLHGMGGVGKSSVALFYAEQFGPSFSEGTLWLRAIGDQVDNEIKNARDRAAVFGSLVRGLDRWAESARPDQLSVLKDRGIPSVPEEAFERFRDALPGWLEEDQNLLVVIDDVPSGLDLVSLIPASPNLSVLVTTRDGGAAAAGWRPVPLGPLDDDEALLLLTNAVDPGRRVRSSGGDPWHGQEVAARRLVEEVGRHPLALDLLAVRLSNGDSLEELWADVAAQDEYFLDVPDELLTLPTGHRPSIMRTIASSISSLSGALAPDAAKILRMLSVLPSAQWTPRAMVIDVLGRGVRPAEALLNKRSLVSRNGDQITMHALTRAVARQLWEKGAPPFENRAIEPTITAETAQWLSNECDRLREKDTSLAASLARDFLVVQESLPGGRTPQQRAQECEAWLALAREHYRNPGDERAEQYATAQQWVRRAQECLPQPWSNGEAMHWYGAEAMRGLIQDRQSDVEIDPDLPLERRIAAKEEALAICERVERERMKIGDRSIEAGEVWPGEAWIVDRQLRGLFNLPGRRLKLSKMLALAPAPDHSVIAGHLEAMAREHAEILRRRSRLDPVPWASIAASHEGLGSCEYHKAVLLDEPFSVAVQHLCSAVPHIRQSLVIRQGPANLTHQRDASKSLRLTLKVVVGLQALRSGPLASERQLLDDVGDALARLDTAPVDSHLRDRSVQETLMAVEQDATDERLRECQRAAVTWLVVAAEADPKCVAVESVRSELFGTQPGEGEVAQIVSGANRLADQSMHYGKRAAHE